ncbi:MAG: chromophore lyase [Prevotella sp.]|nr:chromophore lyase [Prevotella sp.]
MGGFGTAKSVTVSSVSGSSSSSSSSSSSTLSSNSYDLGAPMGWATVGGSVTGSADKNAVTVTTASELISAMSGTDQKTIYVKGTLNFTGQMTVQNAQNKTVYGLPGSALANTTHTSDVSKTGILFLKNCKNIILRNLTFKGAGAYDIDGKDNLTVQNCQYLWVDHCDFQDGVDGNFDANNGSDNMCVSWCRFRYLKSPYAGGSGGSDDHRFSDLWGGSDKNEAKDGGKLRTTFYSCWWDEGCKERMPRVRFGQVHILNCLYSSSVANYCVGAAYRSNIYLEKTAFTSTKAKKTPWKCYATSSGYTDYNITVTGCSGASDTQQRSGSISYFIPSQKYSYTGYDVSKVESVVSQYAGATLNISAPAAARTMEVEEDQTTGITTTDAEATVVSTQYFNARGAEIPAPEKGLNIIKTTLSNGKTTVQKVIIR